MHAPYVGQAGGTRRRMHDARRQGLGGVCTVSCVGQVAMTRGSKRCAMCGVGSRDQGVRLAIFRLQQLLLNPSYHYNVSHKHKTKLGFYRKFCILPHLDNLSFY